MATGTTVCTAGRTPTRSWAATATIAVPETGELTQSPETDGNDSLYGGWGSDRVFGGSGNDELHALAPDGDPDLLNCGPGSDKAWVLRAERPRTQLVGCETVFVVDGPSPDQDEGENADADTEADE